MSLLKKNKQMQHMQELEWHEAPLTVFELEPIEAESAESKSNEWFKFIPMTLMITSWVLLYSVVMILDLVKRAGGYYLSGSLAQQYPLSVMQSDMILTLLS